MAVMCPVAPPPPSYRQRRRDRKHIVAVLATFAAKRPLGCPRWHRRLVSQAWRLLAHSPIVWSKQGVPCARQLGVFYTELYRNTRRRVRNTRLGMPRGDACTHRMGRVSGAQTPPHPSTQPPPASAPRSPPRHAPPPPHRPRAPCTTCRRGPCSEQWDGVPWPLGTRHTRSLHPAKAAPTAAPSHTHAAHSLRSHWRRFSP